MWSENLDSALKLVLGEKKVRTRRKKKLLEIEENKTEHIWWTYVTEFRK